MGDLFLGSEFSRLEDWISWDLRVKSQIFYNNYCITVLLCYCITQLLYLYSHIMYKLPNVQFFYMTDGPWQNTPGNLHCIFLQG